MTSSNAEAWNTKHILMNNLGSKRSLVMKFGQFMQYYKIIFLLKNSSKNVAWKLVQVLSNFQRILCKKDSLEVSMLLRTNFDRFAITYLT